MNRSKNTGVTVRGFDDAGPFKIRVDGTNDFVEKIGLNYYVRFGGPDREEVFTCSGWDNPSILLFDTMALALEAACHVYRIAGLNISIEPTRQ